MVLASGSNFDSVHRGSLALQYWVLEITRLSFAHLRIGLLPFTDPWREVIDAVTEPDDLSHDPRVMHEIPQYVIDCALATGVN